MKKLLITVGSLLILFVGAYTFMKMVPPLSADPSASGSDRQTQLVSIGNKSLLGDIQIVEVLVNNDTAPEKVKIQVSNHEKGFIISEHFDGKEEKIEYTFKELNSFTLKPNTDPQKQLDQLNADNTMDDDSIYALSINHEESIFRVIIKYRHLGISHVVILDTN